MGSTVGESIYKHVLRLMLFQLDPERAHGLALAALSQELPWCWLGRAPDDPRLRVRLRGFDLASPIGLAAGLDKDGDAVPGLQHLGFGYVTVGSILLKPNAGNPKPRLLRRPEQEALMNCYGLPSAGLDAVAAKFKAFAAHRTGTRLITNINTETVEDYLHCIAALAPYSDGIELALQCPNRSDHQSLYPPEDLAVLLRAVKGRWPDKAVFVKLPPYFNDTERDNRMELVELSIDCGLTGVVIPGNYPIEDSRLSRGKGSISGPPCFARNLGIVRELAAVTRGRIAIKATGGVSTGADALQLLAAGATLIDILTSFVYRGWAAPALINAELLALMEEKRIDDIRALQPVAA